MHDQYYKMRSGQSIERESGMGWQNSDVCFNRVFLLIFLLIAHEKLETALGPITARDNNRQKARQNKRVRH